MSRFVSRCLSGRRWRRSALLLAALPVALLAAWAPAHAEGDDSDPAAPAGPVTSGSVTLGAGVATGENSDRALFGQYNGLRTHNAIGILGGDYTRFNAADGSSLSVQGANLLLDTRELILRWHRQGDWKLAADYSELVRRDPLTFRSGILGAGTTTPQVVPVTPGSGSETDLKMKRTAVGVSLSKVWSSALQSDVSLRGERKEGARFFGVGMNCPSAVAPGCVGTTGTNAGWAVLMLPEPVDALHTQAEARLSYAGDKLRLTGGYYGSFYRNSHDTLNPLVPDSVNNAAGTLLPFNTGVQAILSQPVALPPDNDAHQLDLAGNYALTQWTQLNFKLAYAHATQHQDFAGSGLTGAPAGVSNLGGVVDTTSAQVGLTSHPLPKLSVVSLVQYRDQDDHTPIALYNVEGTATYTNRRLPNRKVRGKLQGAYQLTSDYRGALGVDFEEIDRGVFTATSAAAGITSLRQRTEESTLHLELRRRMSDDFSAALRLASSRRDGSNWLQDNSGRGVTEVSDPNAPGVGFASGVFMPTLADRQRDKAKLYADWQPSRRLSAQFSAEAGRDRFTAPSSYGVRNTRMSYYSLDTDYALNERWRLTGRVSAGDQTLLQARPAGVVMSFDNKNLDLGMGVAGTPSGKLDVGAEVVYSRDRSVYSQTLESGASPFNAALLAASGGLPDITYRQTIVKVFSQYRLDKSSQVRLELLHQRSYWNDWTWDYNGVTFAYSDGTTALWQPNQKVTLVSFIYLYRFQ